MDTDVNLPMPAEKLVPHRPPFLFVDSLVEFSGDTGVVQSVIDRDNLFLDEDNSLSEVVMIEIMAQAAAAVKGYSDLKECREIRKGFLVDSREFLFKKKGYMGETINCRIEIVKNFSGFSMLTGRLERDGEELASGILKLWVPEENGK